MNRAPCEPDTDPATPGDSGPRWRLKPDNCGQDLPSVVIPLDPSDDPPPPPADIVGTAFADVLTGTIDDKVTMALGGNDDVFGMEGDDTLDGGAGAGLIGELDLEVTFAPGSNGTPTGTADSFEHEADGAYAGPLTLTGGDILPNAGPTGEDLVAGDLEGTLTHGGADDVTPIGRDGSFLGGAGTAVADAIAGGATGTLGRRRLRRHLRRQPGRSDRKTRGPPAVRLPGPSS